MCLYLSGKTLCFTREFWESGHNMSNYDAHETYPPASAPAGVAQPAAGVKTEGFFKALFDLNFSQFITVKFAKYIYILTIAFHAFAVLVAAGVSGALSDDGGFVRFIFALIVWSVVAVFSLIVVRVGLELAVSIIRTAQNSSHLVENSQRR